MLPKQLISILFAVCLVTTPVAASIPAGRPTAGAGALTSGQAETVGASSNGVAGSRDRHSRAVPQVTYDCERQADQYAREADVSRATGGVSVGSRQVAAGCKDRFEPNDNFDEATRITPGTYDALGITPGDRDVYSLDVSDTESVSARITFSHRQSNLELALIYRDRNDEVQIAKSISDTDDESVTAEVAHADVAYVVVAPRTNETGTSYSMTVTTGREPEPTDPYEPNDEWQNSAALEPGTYQRPQLTAGDSDWYTVDVSAGRSLSASIAFDDSTGNLELGVWYRTDSGWQELTSTTSTDGESVTTDRLPTDSTVYIGVTGDSDDTAAPYTLSVATEREPRPADPFEPNDDWDTAAAVDPGTYQQPRLTAGESDWYKVDVSAGTSLSASIEFDDSTGNLELGAWYETDSGWNEYTSTTASDGESVTTDRIPDDATVYIQVTGDSDDAAAPYSLSLSTETTTSRQFEPNDEYDTATPVEFGTYPNREITAGDVDIYELDRAAGSSLAAQISFEQQAGDLTLAAFYRDGEGGWARATSRTDTAGEAIAIDSLPTSGTVYVVVAGDPDAADATAPYSLTVAEEIRTDGPSLDDLSVDVRRINGRQPEDAGFQLTTEYLDNVTVEVTRDGGEPVRSDRLTISVETQDIAVPLRHVGNGVYRADLAVREGRRKDDIGPFVYTQRLRFDVSSTSADATGTVSTHASVATRHGLLNAPIDGWVYDHARQDVRIDGRRYIVLQMRRDGTYERDVAGKPETAWLVFDTDGQLVRDSEIRRQAALAGYVSYSTRKETAADVATYTETLPSQIATFQRQSEALDALQTARDSLAELSGTLAGAYVTGGSNILAKQSAKAASKALAKKFAKKVLKDYLKKQVFAKNPLGAIDKSMRMASRVELLDARAEFEEAGRMLARHVGENNLDAWNYSDAKRYRQSYTEATYDAMYYMTLRYHMEQESLPEQFQSIATSFTSGATGAPVGLMVRLIQSGKLGYVSAANQKTARLKAIHQLERRSFGQYSSAAQQTGLSLYGDRVLVGFETGS